MPNLVKTDDKKNYTTTNKKFKKNAKQVFAALNYGKRHHGAIDVYGYSYMVLKPELKKNAMYYPADTFNVAKFGVASQGAFHTLGAVILHASPAMLNDLWDSCISGQRLQDTGNKPELLLEAHLFQSVKMKRDVEKVYISKQATDSEKMIAQVSGTKLPDWDTVTDNLQKWCHRNGVRYELLSP